MAHEEIKPKDKVLCIFCCEEKDPSDEHVIPSSLGGNLTIRHVCSDCNSTLGRQADVDFEANYFIARAYKELGWEEKLAEVIKKAEVTATDRESLISMRLKIIDKDDFQIVPQDLPDGSLIVPEDEANDVIQKKVARRSKEYLAHGLSMREIESYKEKLIKDYWSADPNTLVSAPELGFDLIKHSSELDEKARYTKKIPLRAIAKIGYETVFLVLGYRCIHQKFEGYREYALRGDKIPSIYRVSPLDGELSFSPVHQLSLTERDGRLVGLIQLFQGYAWRVCFGPNDIDAFKEYRALSDGRKVVGIGIQMNIESKEIAFFMQMESGTWEFLGVE